MQTVKELLEQKEFCLWEDQEVTMLTREEIAAILSLLSQHEVVVEREDYPADNELPPKYKTFAEEVAHKEDETAAKIYADSKFITSYEDLKDVEKYAWYAFYDGYLAGRQEERQQLSQQQGASPIKLGDRSITQGEFNRMYTHYKDLCDKEDTNGWWENQYYMADKERNELRNWKAEAMAVMPDYPAICKALKVPLGQSIHDKILPAILKLQQLAQQQATKWLKLKEFIQKHIQQLDGSVLTTSGEDKLALLKDILAYAEESAPPSQHQGMRWINASKRTPDLHWDELHIRNAATKEPIRVDSIEEYLKLRPLSGIEWLDESTPLSQQQEVVVESDEDEAAKKYADSKFVSPFDNLYDNLIESDQRIWWAYYNTYKEARQSLRQQLSQQQQQREWISVEDRLPEIGEYVLVNVGVDTVLKGRLMNNGWTAFFADGDKLVGTIRSVSHWQPLPPPPTNQK